MARILLKHGRLVDPMHDRDEVGDILLENGVIAAVGGEITEPADEIVDCTGLAILPGFIDMHTHLRDPGLTHKEDVCTGCAAAAAGGVTGVVCMPNTNPTLDTPEVIRDLLQRAETAKAHVYPVACMTKGMAGEELPDYAALKAAGAVAVSDDGKPVVSAGQMLSVIGAAKQAGLLPISHCEDMTIIQNGIVNEGETARRLGLPGMHRASEDSITAREIALAESIGVPIHIAHVSTRGSAAQIRDAKRRGVQVTAETCPHYFILTDDCLETLDADYRMNPPLREEADRQAILEAVCDGIIDCIVTDHAPHTPEEKANFHKAPNGVIGMETSFAASYTALVKTGRMTLLELARRMSLTPARLLSLPGGGLGIGMPADLAVVDENKSWTVDPEKLHGKSKNCVFKGQTLQGKVVATYLSGKLVYRQECKEKE